MVNSGLGYVTAIEFFNKNLFNHPGKDLKSLPLHVIIIGLSGLKNNSLLITIGNIAVIVHWQ